jgi:hypothetical protein
MIITLKKFGTTLTSRQLGKEAFAAFKPNLSNIDDDELVEIDFEGVTTFSPSWGDEFLSPLLEQYGERLILVNTNNPSVKATLELLKNLEGKNFKIKE